MNDVRRLIRSAALGIADGIAVLTLRPDWAALAHDVAAPHRWLDRVGADQAALTLALAALWCVTTWLAVGLLAIAATVLPGRAGGFAGQLASRVLPAVVVRAVAGVAGLGVLVAPVAPVLAGAGTPAGATPPAAAQLGPAPTWPTDGPKPIDAPAPDVHVGWPTSASPAAPARPAAPTPPTASAPARTTPAPTWPSTPATPKPSPAAPPPGAATASSPARPAPPQQPPESQTAVSPTSADQPVRVQPGDSLWLIAAHRLGADASDADIAAVWPRWYAANRSVIGDDPSLIQPGQVLQAPPSD